MTSHFFCFLALLLCATAFPVLALSLSENRTRAVSPDTELHPPFF